MIASIHQPQYLPWSGYFYKILKSDVFVVFDTVQYPRGKHFGNRNQVKTAGGPVWLTVPVLRRSELLPFSEIPTDSAQDWAQRHWRTIDLAYRKAPAFEAVSRPLHDTYARGLTGSISEVNMAILETLLGLMGITTRLVLASTLEASRRGLQGADYIFAILKELGARQYISGRGAGSQRYIDPEGFTNKGIDLKYYDYTPPTYAQQWGTFISDLSVVDMLLNCGSDSSRSIIERAGRLYDA